MLWLGAYVGVPTKYTVNGKAEDGDPLKARDFNPVVSFGVVVTPLSAVALMVGATYARVASDIATASPAPDPWTKNLVATMECSLSPWALAVTSTSLARC
jgi:hypothetical protein